MGVWHELDRMIAMGWGDIPQHLIPDNWRTEYGPASPRYVRPEAKPRAVFVFGTRKAAHWRSCQTRKAANALKRPAVPAGGFW